MKLAVKNPDIIIDGINYGFDDIAEFELFIKTKNIDPLLPHQRKGWEFPDIKKTIEYLALKEQMGKGELSLNMKRLVGRIRMMSTIDRGEID